MFCTTGVVRRSKLIFPLRAVSDAASRYSSKPEYCGEVLTKHNHDRVDDTEEKVHCYPDGNRPPRT